MKAFVRYGVPVAAVIGLAVAVAPAAGASAFRPVTRVASISTAFEVSSGCDSAVVSTTGHAVLTTTTEGQHTVASLEDSESGDGYDMVIAGSGAFDRLASSYTFEAEGIWIDLRHPAESFHGLVTEVFYVTGSNAPSGVEATGVSLRCGL